MTNMPTGPELDIYAVHSFKMLKRLLVKLKVVPFEMFYSDEVDWEIDAITGPEALFTITYAHNNKNS